MRPASGATASSTPWRTDLVRICDNLDVAKTASFEHGACKLIETAPAVEHITVVVSLGTEDAKPQD